MSETGHPALRARTLNPFARRPAGSRRPAALQYIVGDDAYFEVQRRAGLAVTMWLVCGVLVVVALAGPGGELRSPDLLLGTVVAFALLGVVIVPLARRRRWWFDAFALVAPIGFVLGVAAAGPGRSDSAALVIALVAIAPVVIRTRIAVIAIIEVLIGYLLVVSIDAGYASPASRVAMVITASIAVGVLLLWLLAGLERLALAEREATAGLEAANHTLQQFLSPQVAATVVAGTDPALLEPHRRLIAVVFIDLRGFTSFTAGSEPEEVLDVLGEYYTAFGEEADHLDGTIGSYAGDGVMAFFGDPIPCDDPAGRALQLAQATSRRLGALWPRWVAAGHQLDHGIGIAYGYATLGIIGHRRREYTPLGSVVNLASRLCAEAAPGEILIDAKTLAALDGAVATAPLQLQLKGFPGTITAHRLIAE